jgi:uncharacterized protein YukE
MSDVTSVSVPRLMAYASHVKSSSDKITDGAHQMTERLRRTLAEWGEGTDSRNAFDAFEKRVNDCIREMNEALAAMPTAIQNAADRAARAEKANRDLFS